MTELPPGATPVDRLGAGSRIREWEVVRFVARGAFGQVFEARRDSWVDDEPTRALKVFDPILSSAARSNLLNEFNVLRTVRHPNLLAGHDAFDLADGELAGSVVFVMELADTDLASVVVRHGPIEAVHVAALGADVARGLAALHDAGHLHGDVKPENVLVSGGTWKLGDFGVSTSLHGSYAHPGGATLEFRPPEVSGGDAAGRVHRSADVWALGVTLWMAATGSHPFVGADSQLRYAAVLRGDRRSPSPDLDPRLAALLDRWCLAPDPHVRAGAGDLAEVLDELADSLAAHGAAVPTAPARVASVSGTDVPPAERPTVIDEPTHRFAPPPLAPPPPAPPPATASPDRGPVADQGIPPGTGTTAGSPARETWWVGAAAGAVAAAAIVQVASLVAAAVSWDLGPRRGLYAVVVAVLAGATATVVGSRRLLLGRAVAAAALAGLVVTAVATVVLFGALA